MLLWHILVAVFLFILQYISLAQASLSLPPLLSLANLSIPPEMPKRLLRQGHSHLTGLFFLTHYGSLSLTFLSSSSLLKYWPVFFQALPSTRTSLFQSQKLMDAI